MVFSSLLFLFIYLPVVLIVYYIAPRKFRNFVLLIFSLAFYGWGEPIYIFIMIFSTLVDYTHGILLDRFRAQRKKAKLVVMSCVTINLSLLFFFKYFDFIADTISRITPLSIEPMGLALPIGISFYTFQTMSYTIDVYRNQAERQKKYIPFSTYVTLFPQLIAGPIVRYKDIAKQLTDRKESVNMFASGVQLFIIGLGKKVLLANNIGILWEHYQHTAVENLSVSGAWLGIIAFSFQIYFDFSGYSDMAIGLGRMFGFEFLINFNYPYISSSITEFWRRWHISLGTWFREYIYIPLGGNRKGMLNTLRNIGVVWFLTGLWHGASWNFVLWGLYFGVILTLEKLFLLRFLEKIPRWINHVYAIFLIIFGWVLFAFEDMSAGIRYAMVMTGLSGARLYNRDFLYQMSNYWILLIIMIIASTPAVSFLYKERLNPKFTRKAVPAYCLVVLIVSIAYLVDDSFNPFLYFRF